MRCAIIGGSITPRNLSVENTKKFEDIATYFAKNNIEVLTGGCGGYPYLIGKMCIRHKAAVHGYSAANNKKEHVEIYEHPINGCSSISFLENDEKNINYRFLLRSLPLIFNADVIIAIEGNWGTLFELITGIICGKKIIIWQGFGGICDTFYSIYTTLANDCQYNYGESVFIAKSIGEIIKILDNITCN